MKKTLAVLLILALALGCTPVLAAGELFPAVNTYAGYADVPKDAWYAQAAQACYETGLMTGTQAGFSPAGQVTVAECAAMAARIKAALTGTPVGSQGNPWYQVYLDYLKNGAPASYESRIPWTQPTRTATRAEFLDFLYLASVSKLAEVLPAINAITALPDTADPTVLRFYNAGVLTGKDAYGTFDPAGTLSRAEAASMVARLVRPALRVSFVPQTRPAAVMTVNGRTVEKDIFQDALSYNIYMVDYYLYNNTKTHLDWNTDYGVGDLRSFFVAETRRFLTQQAVQEENAERYGLDSPDNLATYLFTPTKDQLSAFLKENNMMAAKHILVGSADEADVILNALKEKPTLEQFNALMSVYSTDPGSKSYPDGYLFGPGEMVSEFENGVKALDFNTYSGAPVQSTYGYHIILRLDPATHPDAVNLYREQMYEKQVDAWVSAAKVTMDQSFLDSLTLKQIQDNYQEWINRQ